jgi:hypothetical protein
VLIIVAAVVVVGVMYFTSDVAKTRIDAAADQYAHWTPENIAKDPENYLRFCEAEATKVLQSLKASEIAVAQNRASLENTLHRGRQQDRRGREGAGRAEGGLHPGHHRQQVAGHLAGPQPGPGRGEAPDRQPAQAGREPRRA